MAIPDITKALYKASILLEENETLWMSPFSWISRGKYSFKSMDGNIWNVCLALKNDRPSNYVIPYKLFLEDEWCLK